MKRHRSWPVVFLVLAVSWSSLAPLLAQEEEKLPVEDPPPWGDLASDEDPSLSKEEPRFGEPLDEYDGSPAFLELPDDKEATEPGEDPGLTKWAALNCQSYPASSPPVQPIRMASANARYFSFKGVPLILVGASADSGCLFRLAETDQCNLNNYPATFALNENLNAPTHVPLNKVRVWVGMGYGYTGTKQVTNAPFLWVTPPAGPNYWLLDAKAGAGADYAEFFARLRDVVNEARLHNLFVEVTFFIPFEGGDFNIGPWSKPGSLAKAAEPPGTVNLVPAGFSSAYYQVHKDTGSPDAVQNEKMRAYQANLIKWTVDALWCFDNVIWEIANEPEGLGPIEPRQPKKAVDPVAVAKWQRTMIYEVRKAEKAYSPRLAYGHLVAAQPFTSKGATALFDPTAAPSTPGWQPDPNFPLEVQILNGHYTTVSTSVPTFGSTSTHPLDAGAMNLIRSSTLNTKKIPFGFNETNVTNLSGARGTKSHLNGAVVRGGLEPARAEAWEYLFSGGTAYDHFGYLGLGATPNATAKAVRIQLGRLLDLYGKRRFDLPAPTPQLTDFGTANTGDFFQGSIGAYKAWECRTRSQRYWAALAVTAKSPQNPAITAYRALLLYLHHSTPRCKDDDKDYNNCNNLFTPFGSYDTRSWTVAPPPPTSEEVCNVRLGPAGYQETLTLKSGSYEVSWLDPETTLPYAGSPASQTVTCPPGCTITSPVYKFDILLKLVKR